MWIRFLLISLLKWFVTLAAIYALFAYLLPARLTGFLSLLPTWILAFLLAYLFATWALAKKTPSRQDALHLAVIWLLVTVTGFLAYGLLLSERGPWVVVTPELLVQFAVEIIAIFLAAFALRRKRVKSQLGEG